jgi:hypothetical protein
MGYLGYWEKIIGEKPERITYRTLFAKNTNTAFCIIPNGSQSGLSYYELGEYVEKIKDRIAVF